MELNQVQLLVHNDVSLNKLRVDHGIRSDVQIDRPSSNEDANLVEGNEDQILVWIWLIHQVGLQFAISLMLKEVMAHCCLTFMQVSVNFVRTVLAMDTLMREHKLSPLVP